MSSAANVWRQHLTRRIATWTLGFAIVTLGGCAPYQFGTASMFPSDIRTVYVPQPRNDTFRHDLGPALAESLVREIETRTPYKVVGDPGADSILACRISGETKQVLTETDSDDPRALDFGVTVTASWTDRSGTVMMQNATLPTTPLTTSFGRDQRFVPEAGQSMATVTVRTADELARQIVGQMESRW